MQVVSANRLADGTVVYAGRDGSWVERLADARVFSSKPEADSGLLAAQSDVKRNLIVDPCLVDVCAETGGLRPLTLREAIRAQGPTVDFSPRMRPNARSAKPAPEGNERRGPAAVLHLLRREDSSPYKAEEPSRKTA